MNGGWFLCLLACFVLCAGAVMKPAPCAAQEARYEANVPVQAITSGPKAHWFAYYDKLQFDPSDRYVLGMEVAFEDRAPEAGDAIVLGMVDLQDNNRWVPFAESTAWCWQQGCMLQWIPGSNSEVIYNVRRDGAYGSVVQDVFTGEKRELPRAVYAVSPDGKTAVSLNFARVGRTRPGYGYNGIADPTENVDLPEDDGIYSVDLTTGDSRLIVKLSDIAKMGWQDTMDDGGQHWFNHLLFNTDGSRFVFLHRWHRGPERKSWYTRFFTAAPDGSDVYCLADHGMTSHFIWRNPAQVLAWSREPAEGDQTWDRFFLYTDRTDQAEVIGDGILTVDGHCTYSPDGEWVLTDTYPNKERMQTLMLYRPADKKLVTLGEFYQEAVSDTQLRTDLHPRWSRDGKTVCIDSKCSGQRQLYLIDVSGVLD